MPARNARTACRPNPSPQVTDPQVNNAGALATGVVEGREARCCISRVSPAGVCERAMRDRAVSEFAGRSEGGLLASPYFTAFHPCFTTYIHSPLRSRGREGER